MGGDLYLEMPVGVIESYYQERADQMVSLGSLKSQHLAECLLSRHINLRLCQLPAIHCVHSVLEGLKKSLLFKK